MAELGDIVEKEAGAGGVRFDDQGLVFELVEVFLDILIAGLGLQLDGGNGAGHGDLFAFALVAGHEALDVFGFGGLDAVTAGRLEEDARIAERDGAVTVVGDDETYGHNAMAEIVDAEDGFFFAGVIGLDGDGDVFFFVGLDGREGAGRLNRRNLWSLAEADTASNPMIRSGSVQTTFIVLDCII